MNNDGKSMKSLSKEYINSYRRNLPVVNLSYSESDEIFTNILKVTNPLVVNMQSERKVTSKSLIHPFGDLIKGFFIVPGPQRILRPALVIGSVLIIILVMNYFVFDGKVEVKSDHGKTEIVRSTPPPAKDIQQDNIPEVKNEIKQDNISKSKMIRLDFLPLTLSSRAFTEDPSGISETDYVLFAKAFQLLEETLIEHNLVIASNKNGRITTGWYYYKLDNSGFYKSRLIISQIKNDETGLSIVEERISLPNEEAKTKRIIKGDLYKKMIRDFKTKYYSTFE